MTVKLTKKEADYIIKIISSVPEADAPTARTLKGKLAKPQMKPASRKAKGREFQYKVCEMIAEAIGESYDQKDPDCLIHSNEMGQSGTDVILRGEARAKFPFSVECKAQENLKVADWIRQSQSNRAEGTDWMVVFKTKNLDSVPICMTNFQSFLKLICRQPD